MVPESQVKGTALRQPVLGVSLRDQRQSLQDRSQNGSQLCPAMCTLAHSPTAQASSMSMGLKEYTLGPSLQYRERQPPNYVFGVPLSLSLQPFPPYLRSLRYSRKKLSMEGAVGFARLVMEVQIKTEKEGLE